MELFLPIDIAKTICIYGTDSLENSGILISSFTRVNQAFKKSFNHPGNCLSIIKDLSHQFDCSHQQVAEILRIKAARNRYYLQNTFQSFCKRGAHDVSDDNLMKSRFSALKRDNVDFNFTYGHYHHTGLMVALSPTNPEPATAKYLILNGANLHIEDTSGSSGYSYIFQFHAYIIPFLIECNKLEPNKKSGALEQTPLINLILQRCYSEHDRQVVQEGIKLLLDAGADPELEDKKKRSPLSLAREKNEHPECITLLEEAIKKKHATK